MCVRDVHSIREEEEEIPGGVRGTAALLGRPVAACEACRRRCGRRHQRRTRQQRQRPSKAVAAVVVVAAVRLIRGGAAGMAAAALREGWAVGSRCPSTNASGNSNSGSNGGVVVAAVTDAGSLNLTSVSFHLWLSFSPAAPSTRARVCVCVYACVFARMPVYFHAPPACSRGVSRASSGRLSVIIIIVLATMTVIVVSHRRVGSAAAAGGSLGQSSLLARASPPSPTAQALQALCSRATISD